VQIELTLKADPSDTYIASDLGYLLHKNPAKVFTREVTSGTATVFYSEVSDSTCTAVLHVDVDPIALVRGKNQDTSGLLDQYVNTRPYVANSLLSVALNKCYSQTMAGKSKDRQSLADKKLPWSVNITPVVCEEGAPFINSLFEPLGYECLATPLIDENFSLYAIRLKGDDYLSVLLNQLYVLIPVLDNAKHWWVDQDEIDKLMEKSGPWLAEHPERETISRRALKNQRDLSREFLRRLSIIGQASDSIASLEEQPTPKTSNDPERVRLHDQRLDRVAEILKSHSVSRVLDIGCGEGKLIKRLVKDPQFTEIAGIDPSLRSIQKARDLLFLENAGEAKNDRIVLKLGSLTYADRRLRGFDAATLVEVIEHVDSDRLASLERSLFGDARPAVIIITTPNADYNKLFPSLTAGEYRHSDHRFEWTREQFANWSTATATEFGYRVTTEALGPEDDTHGGPSQLATFVIDVEAESSGI